MSAPAPAPSVAEELELRDPATSARHRFRLRDGAIETMTPFNPTWAPYEHEWMLRAFIVWLDRVEHPTELGVTRGA